ncbi:ATPdependent DNA ligase EC 6511 [Bradyrhizobium sp.]|nr:ATPdependent DNA ligase EC 6511 [Bradyrhizobium sp.]
MVAEIRRGRVALYSRNGKIISHSYVEVAKALEGVKAEQVRAHRRPADAEHLCRLFRSEALSVISTRSSPPWHRFEVAEPKVSFLALRSRIDLWLTL